MGIRRGPALMIGATLMFTMMVAAVKVVRQELGPFEVMVWRSAVSAPIAFAIAWPAGVLAVTNRRAMALRVVLGTSAMACFFTAAKGLLLADLSIIARLQPIFVAFLAPLVLGRAERSGGLIWGVLVAGLVGCGLIIGPDLQVGSSFGLYALAASVFSACAHVTVRHLGKSDDPRVIVFWFQIGACCLAFLLYVGVHGNALPVPPMHLWGWLAAVGLFATAGQILMTFAYKQEQASRVAAAGYAGPLFGLLGDVLVFGDWPAPLALLGGVLVVGAGLLLVLR